ncbi:tetraprenyl-beta-curcumene synthase family protein [Virgibacillus halophilus]|uniref:Tetraprenyl-beta-curcumene synthase family protein n=1 Tax=Tigheibacillus halophilus TaxID=361280 RepID=A0ABU5C1Y7_9BACI|nr:tetraprenyl-beta-curcumene synthase family protein [Virgibacillus halophilus]
MKKVPGNAVTLMVKTYVRIFPEVSKQLAYWKNRALEIPDGELRNQALASLETKRFHCQGGAVYALIAGERYKEAIQFIVAYQTISDYLDNLCDRSTSLDAQDFQLLHEAMRDALSPENPVKNYYEKRKEHEDGGYLAELVKTCQAILTHIPEYSQFQHQLLWLEGLYADLQVHKHVRVVERVPRLKQWYEQHEDIAKYLQWQEFSAAAGSTLGIFCVVSYSLGYYVTAAFATDIVRSYFPYMQGLHILLDYYIDQQEDDMEGDLNFCSFYKNSSEMNERLQFFADMADRYLGKLPDTEFHLLVRKGLVGLYLGDPKARMIPDQTGLKKESLG